MALISTCYTLAYVTLDVVITTVLYLHGSQFIIIREEVMNFSILTSLLDLWAAALLRSSLLLGAYFGVLWNRDDGPRRVARASTAVVLLSITLTVYALVKLLLLTELGPLVQQPWALALLSWTVASSLGILLPWALLQRAFQPATGHGRRQDEVSGEAEKLVNGECESGGSVEESGEETKASSRATLGRLLAYCKKDGGLLLVAVLFLLISAVCKFGLDGNNKKAHKNMCNRRG